MVHKNDWRPELDETSAVPLYEQMIEQVSLAITAGLLSPGDALPSVRTLAAQLRVNPNTAARAVREMQSLGLAEALRGVGSVVAPKAPAIAPGIARRVLDRELEAAIRVARQLGLGLGSLRDALREKWRETDGHSR